MNYTFFVNKIIDQSINFKLSTTFKTHSNMAKLLKLKTKDFQT